MTEYVPDNWVVIFLDVPEPHYRVLAGWSGGYLSGSSWKLNSGITKVEEDGDYYLFHGSSGSIYKCYKESYCLRNNNAYIWEQLKSRYKDDVQMLNEDTNWSQIDWIIDK